MSPKIIIYQAVKQIKHGLLDITRPSKQAHYLECLQDFLKDWWEWFQNQTVILAVNVVSSNGSYKGKENSK